MRTIGIRLFDLQLRIKVLYKRDTLDLLDSGRDKSNGEWQVYVVRHCLHEFSNSFVLLDKMGQTNRHGVDVIYEKLYEQCIKHNPKLSARPTKMAPCPFCRSTSITCSAIMSPKTTLWGKRRVYCPKCKLFVFKSYRVQPVTTACSTNEAAKKAWNNFCLWVNSLSSGEKKEVIKNLLNGTSSIDYKSFETKRKEIKDMMMDNSYYCVKCESRHGRAHECEDRLDKGLSKFWMVACFEHTGEFGQTRPRGDGAKVRHFSKERAEKEAKKLAKENTTQHFVVLEAVDAFVVPSPKPQRIILGDWTDEE